MKILILAFLSFILNFWVDKTSTFIGIDVPANRFGSRENIATACKLEHNSISV